MKLPDIFWPKPTRLAMAVKTERPEGSHVIHVGVTMWLPLRWRLALLFSRRLQMDTYAWVTAKDDAVISSEPAVVYFVNLPQWVPADQYVATDPREYIPDIPAPIPRPAVPIPVARRYPVP